MANRLITFHLDEIDLDVEVEMASDFSFSKTNVSESKLINQIGHLLFDAANDAIYSAGDTQRIPD